MVKSPRLHRQAMQGCRELLGTCNEQTLQSGNCLARREQRGNNKVVVDETVMKQQKVLELGFSIMGFSIMGCHWNLGFECEKTIGRAWLWFGIEMGSKFKHQTYGEWVIKDCWLVRGWCSLAPCSNWDYHKPGISHWINQYWKRRVLNAAFEQWCYFQSRIWF